MLSARWSQVTSSRPWWRAAAATNPSYTIPPVIPNRVNSSRRLPMESEGRNRDSPNSWWIRRVASALSNLFGIGSLVRTEKNSNMAWPARPRGRFTASSQDCSCAGFSLSTKASAALVSKRSSSLLVDKAQLSQLINGHLRPS